MCVCVNMRCVCVNMRHVCVCVCQYETCVCVCACVCVVYSDCLSVADILCPWWNSPSRPVRGTDIVHQ